MEFLNIRIIITALLLLLSTQAQAILLTPMTPCIDGKDCWKSNVNSQPKASDIQILVGTNTILTELYKSEVPKPDPLPDPLPDTSMGIDSGPSAGSYDTEFSNPAFDPANATITYIGGIAISCSECYIAIKDGNNNPSLYVFDISGWDGQQSILLTDFWPETGGMSNVAIWGGASTATVPEPATLALLGLGLIGISFGARRNRS